jgi:benzoyl-CoA reductase subunit C
MLFSNICDVARNLSGVWQRNFPEKLTFYLHFPQNTAPGAPVEYLVSEYQRLAQALGCRVEKDFEARLAFHIGVRNRQQALLRDVQEERRKAPWKMSWAAHHALRKAGLALSGEAHASMLEEALKGLRSASVRPRDGVRVLVEGAFCEQPSADLLEVVEDAGAFVLDDDCLLSQRWFSGNVPLNGGSPLRTLAESYVCRSVPSSVRHEGAESRAEALLRRVREEQADGVLFMSPKFCEPALYDYVRMKNVLEAARVPHMAVEYQERGGAYDTVQMQIQTFVESVLFFAKEGA